MSNGYTLTRNHLIFGICLPLALLLGYLLAEPLESGSLAVVVMTLCVLATPLMMRFYHPLLVATCNSAFILGFLPGSPPAWMLVAAVGCVFMLVNRAVDPAQRIVRGGMVAWSLLAILLVVSLTAVATGGVGLRALGSGTYGGRRYVQLVLGIAAYFVLASRGTPGRLAFPLCAVFFLSAGTSLIGNLVYWLGDRFYAAFYFIAPYSAINQAGGLNAYDPGMTRISGWTDLGCAVMFCMLARYGLGGMLDVRKLWRLGLAFPFVVAGLLGGFRWYAGFVLLVFGILFMTEGIYRSRQLFVALALTVLCSLGLMTFSKQLPLSIQRAISFLPVEVNPAAERSAKGTIEWRVEMWKLVAPEIPKYLFKGKGYRIDPGELQFARENAHRGYAIQAEWAVVSGDYHNGPLSILIPFGIWGAIGFLFFTFASLRYLILQMTRCPTELININRTIFAAFLAKLVFFLVLVGGFESDLPSMAFLMGLSVSINGELRSRQEQEVWGWSPQPDAA